MNQSQKWGRSRYLALLAVCFLHVVLLNALFLLPKTRFLANSATPPIEILILPPPSIEETPRIPSAASRNKKLDIPPTPPSPTAITLTSQADVETPGSGVDWEQEAQNVAATIAKSGSPQQEPQTPTISPFAPAPAHHAGDQIPAADGTWIVYVSDYCYQVSSAIGAVSNASHNGMGLQTYCHRRSNTGRGDLFNQLPAYKLNHPDN